MQQYYCIASKLKNFDDPSVPRIPDTCNFNDPWVTNKALVFTFNKAPNNPNELFETQKANSVGYSAMFNAIANYLIVKNNMQRDIEAYHRIGKLELLGINLHQFTDRSFFKDHDYNEARNRQTGKVIYIDPSLSDYSGIKRISKKE